MDDHRTSSETDFGHGLKLRIVECLPATPFGDAEVMLEFTGAAGTTSVRSMPAGYFARWRMDGPLGGTGYANSWRDVIQMGFATAQPGVTSEPWWDEIATIAALIEPTQTQR